MEDFDLPEDLAIRVQGVGKTYRLGVINPKTFRDELLYRFLRLQGKDARARLARIGSRARMEPGQFDALDDVSFDVKKGETVGLIGSNGAGKSTILKILARITTPTRGDVWIRGRVGSMLEIGTGFHPELTGRENIYLNGSILGMSKAEIDAKFDEIVEFSEIDEFLDTPVKRYSSGMYVKLAFSIASSLDTDILLLDEVLAVGDAAFRKKSLARMKEIAASGRTILFVSHSMGQIREICSRCLWFDHGLIRMDGPTEGVASEYGKTIGDGSAAKSKPKKPPAPPRDPLRIVKYSPRFNTDRKGWDIRVDWDTGDGRPWEYPRVCLWLRSWTNKDVPIAAFDSTVGKGLPRQLPAHGSLRVELSPDVRLTPGIYFIDCKLDRNLFRAFSAKAGAQFKVRSLTPPFLWKKMPLYPSFFNIRHEWRLGPGKDYPEALPPEFKLPDSDLSET